MCATCPQGPWTNADVLLVGGAKRITFYTPDSNMKPMESILFWKLLFFHPFLNLQLHSHKNLPLIS